MKKLIIIFLFLIVMASCNETQKSNSTISEKIEKQCKGKTSCEINMRDLIKEPWDKMFVFKEGVSLEQINKTLGFEYKYFEDIASRIIFAKGNEVVFHEDQFPNVESRKNGELVFNMGDTVLFKVYLPDEAIFNVQKVDLDKGSYYQLTNLK